MLRILTVATVALVACAIMGYVALSFVGRQEAAANLLQVVPGLLALLTAVLASYVQLRNRRPD